MHRFSLACRCGLLSCLAGFLFATPARAADRVDFNRDVKPILADKCFSCHGPDRKQRKAGLRLDNREAALVSRLAASARAGAG